MLWPTSSFASILISGMLFVVVSFAVFSHLDYPSFRDNLSLFTWGFKKILFGSFEHPNFLGSNNFFFSFEGKKEEKNRSDVVSFSCTPISRETRAGHIVAYTCIRLNPEPL